MPDHTVEQDGQRWILNTAYNKDDFWNSNLFQHPDVYRLFWNRKEREYFVYTSDGII